MRYKSLGDVNKSPYMKGNKIILEMTDGFYDGQSVSSVIEFVCSLEKNGPVLINNDNHTYTFQWFTALVCNKKELTLTDNTLKKTFSVNTNELNFSIYICPKNEFNINCDLDNDLKPSKPERSVILFIDNKIIKYPLTQNLRFTHDRKLICNQNNTISIKFSFICGFELQKPKIKSNDCVSNVLFIDPKMCEKKLECRANMYDLTPLKGIYVVIHETIKYYINFCVPGEEGVGVIKELNRTNYTMGYQTQPPEKGPADVVEVVFKNGDYKSANCLNEKINPKIKFECDLSERKGRPLLMKSNNKCMLEFLWKTSLVCRRNLVQINVNNKCLGIINDYSNNFVNNKIIHLINILEINEFFDNSTSVKYSVNFCNGSICNGSKCYRNMTLLYDIYRKQLIASFKDIDLTKLEVTITCPKTSENLSPTYQVSSTYNFVSINTYSNYVCCMSQTSKEMCNMSTTYETNYVEKKLFTSFENPKLRQTTVVKKNFFNSDLVDSVTQSGIEEQIEKTMVYSRTILPSADRYTTTSTTKYSSNTFKKASSFSFLSGKFILVIMILLFSVLFWYYGCNILQGIRNMFNLIYARRRLGARLHLRLYS